MSVPVEEMVTTANRRDPARAEVIERVFRQIGDVSSLPSRAGEIIAMAKDTGTDAEDLIEVIRSDPAMAMRIMRTVNSSYHAVREPVSNLKQAVMLLGYQEIRNIAMSAYVAPLFRETRGYKDYTREGLWDHMVGTATVAQEIARVSGRINQHEAYLAGLLHDIGFIMIDQYLHKPFRRIVDGITPERRSFEVEHDTIGFDHGELGEYVTLQWKLPTHLTDAIGHHHHPGEYEGEHRDMVYVVTLADWLCDFKGRPALGISTASPPPVELFDHLELDRDAATAIIGQLNETLDQAISTARSQLR